MTKFEGLISAIYESDMSKDEKEDELDFISASLMRHFVNYMGYVTDMEIQTYMIKSGSSSGADDYLFRCYDEKRRRAHDECIEVCNRINRLCDEHGIDRICDFDTDNRHEVAKFVGESVTELYRRGIGCKDDK